jgi:ribosomal protein S18 acetylase RimI-like enzyme
MQDITIYKVSLQDVEALQAIGRVTFSQTFSEHNNAEDMEAYLKTSYAIEKLTAEINNPESEFYFAKENENIIGYLKINTGKAQTEIKNLDAFEIERIYVDQAYLGKKIGQILFQKALQLAMQKKAAYVWLGVWEENHRAIAFYKKNGFVPFDKHIFKLGNDEQTDIMMKLDLSF